VVVARAFGFSLLIGAVVALGLAPRADAQPNQPRIKLGMLQGMFRDTPEALVTAVAKPFHELFRRQTGLNGDVEMFPDCEALAQKMKAKQIHIGVFHGFEYAWVKPRYPEIQPLVVTIPPGRKAQACLVVHKDSKAASPADLKGECVRYPTGTKAHCYLFMDRLREELPDDCCCRSKCEPKSPEEVLDAIAGGQTAAGLVDVSHLTSYETNKPGAYNQLRVLARSEPFPPAVIAYRKDFLDSTVTRQVRNGLVDANKTPQGRAFMMLWKLRGFEDTPANFEAEMQRIAKAYPPPAAPATGTVPTGGTSTGMR
jgi:ABC-type phosphate/phosphonate transport system substrate-binding protein